MKKKVVLDAYEQEIEDNLEKAKPSKNEKKHIAMLKEAAKNYMAQKQPITIRVNNDDITAIKAKAAKVGIPYQTYLNIIIHKEAVS